MRKIGRAVGAVLLALVAVETIGLLLVPSWRVDASEISPGTPAQIWAWYADSNRTPNWDHLVVRRLINGKFETGTTGSNQGTGGPAFPWTFTDVQTNRQYTEVTTLPLGSLTATHVLTPVQSGTRIDHALIVSGPLAWLYRLVLYSAFKTGIHEALHRLAVGAPLGPAPTHRVA
jgi:hypothetical protein